MALQADQQALAELVSPEQANELLQALKGTKFLNYKDAPSWMQRNWKTDDKASDYLPFVLRDCGSITKRYRVDRQAVKEKAYQERQPQQSQVQLRPRLT